MFYLYFVCILFTMGYDFILTHLVDLLYVAGVSDFRTLQVGLSWLCSVCPFPRGPVVSRPALMTNSPLHVGALCSFR